MQPVDFVLEGEKSPVRNTLEWTPAVGQHWSNVNGEYLNLVIYDGDFTDQVKQVVKEAAKP